MVKDLYKIKNVLDYQIHKVLKRSPFSYDELYQVAYLGYLNAKKNCDPKVKTMPLQYASKYIRKELLNYLYSEYDYINKKNNAPKDMDQTTFLENNAPEVVENPTLDPRLDQLIELLPTLSDKLAYVVSQFYLVTEPKQLKDLAKEMGVTEQRIHQYKYQGLAELQNEWRKKHGV